MPQPNQDRTRSIVDLEPASERKVASLVASLQSRPVPASWAVPFAFWPPILLHVVTLQISMHAATSAHFYGSTAILVDVHFIKIKPSLLLPLAWLALSLHVVFRLTASSLAIIVLARPVRLLG